MELLMARLGQPPMDEQALYERINHEDREKQLTAFLDCHRDLFSYEKTAEKIAVEPLLPEKVPLLTEPLAWEPLFSPFLMHSYTSMAHKTAVEERYATVAPRDYNNPVKSVHTLPAGKEIGIALHQIFERMPFHSVRSYKDVESYVPSWLQDWGPVMGSLVYQTLHTPLPLLTGPFALHYLFPSNKLIEWEFMIPTQDGLIKGFVDLIFEHQGFYYLVDWKSNWLGPNAAAYTDTYLEAAMLAENYDLQLQIYTEALRCYLEKTDPRPFKDCFGGAFYLFSRGMGEGQNGIYYARDFFGHAGAFPILGQQVATTM